MAKAPISIDISFHLPVRPFARMYQRGSKWTDFRENLYERLLEESVAKIQIWFISGKIIGFFTQGPK